MGILRRLLIMAISSFGIGVQAQNPIADLGGSTTREKNVFAVYDLRGSNIRPDAVKSIALDAIRLYSRDTKVMDGIAPLPYPDYPGQMTIGRRQSGGPKPDCAGEVFSIEGIDSSMAKYGEKTYHRVCLFPYAGGYRINYFAIFAQQSGAGSSNPNVIGAMFGRALGGLVGLGDSSTAINKILGKIESGLSEASIGFKLVQLQPAGMPDRVVVADDLPRPAAPAPAPAPVQAAPAPPAQAQVMAPPATTEQDRNAEQQAAIRQVQAMIMQQRDGVRQTLPPQPVMVQETPGRNPAAARKELTAMGLQYFSQEQFVAAIRRGDTLAVTLFINGAGVDLNAGGAGATPLAIAEANGRQDIVGLLKSSGAR